MFHRILVEDWQRALSVLSISLFLAVFVLHSIRVRCLSRESIAKMETLPLEADDHDQAN
jgi:hypothetical protein